MSQFGELTNITDAALTWHNAGCCVIPAQTGKRPSFDWKEFQGKRPTELMLQEWYTRPGLGVGIICGAISGGLEMLELEGRATTGEHFDKILAATTERGIDWLWDQLLDIGYAEWTPSGGLHFLYRISDEPVPGNTKVAQRPPTDEELAAKPDLKVMALAETRGEGGFVVVAPTAGNIHPDGGSWTVARGTIGQIPITVTWADRCLLHEAIHAALDEMPPAVEWARPASSPALRPLDGARPGDDFMMKATWEEILEPHGWKIHSRTMSETFWTRPGKKISDGRSASTGLLGTGLDDRLFVWSSSTVFATEKPYNKFSAYTLLEHSGDFAAAARELSRRGYGSATPTTSYVAGTLPTTQLAPRQPQTVDTTVGEPASTEVAVRDPNWRADWKKPHVPADAFVYADRSLLGAADVYAAAYEDTFKYCAEKKKWFFFNGRVWGEDRKERFESAVKTLLEHAGKQARQLEADDGRDELLKWVRSMGRASSPNIARWARSDERIAVAPEEFDANRYLVTTNNGVYDLESAMFQPGHDPKMMLTKSLPVTFDKDATAPRWERFLEQVLPDPAVRSYVQRAIGHTLLGDAEQRALFLLHGKSGTGKSQFTRVMELMFGDYAETASATTFNATSKSATLTNDLNDLRGKRFVSLSELDEDERLNESLVKRLTGGDTAKSRGLYQENQQWRVEFTMWMATNYLPRLNSDDNAIWRRVKPIEFPVEVATLGKEVGNLGDKIFAEEAAGIFNWMLQGVADYREQGLDDLDCIVESVAAYRNNVDTVAQFVEAAVEERMVVVADEQQMPFRNLYAMFVDWCQRNGHRHPLGERRFGQRMESLGFVKKRTSTGVMWLGIGTGNFGMLGTMRQ